MKFKITFQVTKPGQMLPLSYQYELSSWIYSLMAIGNSDFTDFLHQKGFASAGKKYKFFSFSQLCFPPKGFSIHGDKMKINAKEISFEISFLMDNASQNLIIGLFEKQQMRLGDRQTQVDLFVKSVELLPQAILEQKTVKLSCSSPMVVSAPVIFGKKLQHRYLSPNDAEFESYFIQNLIQKYVAATEHELIEPSAGADNIPISFKLLSDKEAVKSRLIKLKANCPAETKVKGFLFDFEIDAAPELIKLGYLSGFGHENAMGFGSVKLIS
jgi:CRISPR-associated endoribonuclease Cas6